MLGRRDKGADRVVPPTGFTARLTVFAAAAMAFLAVFALALSLATGRLATTWSEQLARSSTVRISAPEGQMAAQTAAALRLLQQTPGVASARALSEAEQQALLEPWFGPDLPVAQLPVPQIIEVTETAEGYDPAGLRLRLQAEVPGAVLDDHARWRAPLVDAAARLRLLAWLAAGLIAATVGAIVTLAANAALAANAQVIAVLRLVGATDTYIARAFVRRFTLRALIGAAAGTVAGMVAVYLMPSGSETAGFLTGLAFRGWHWAVPLLVPPLAAAVAFVATAVAARRVLGGLS
ncbi:MAG: cell division protein FtsX [Rhodobacteraceae bacterium]|jgi:cell division transport system permease protein|uniref:Cell division transport system permease protein n=1 Tax=Salipiger profundus TaxID=1229727 RepID=A0A1U7D1J8_9RHOB|nr:MULTISPECIES: FtsX-like permease family protein [Salipiger]APX21950.1 cell division transport system permease protein [Salipiger profundus]MAB08125.1 cell division protein FtsX [Paracoccaceae bacterium]GGA06435.1 cell division protein FtsX [Salipiger profundus]